MNPQEFSQLISLASKYFFEFKREYSLNENILHLLLQSSNLIRNFEYTPGFILAFFALERIITELWKKIPIQQLIEKGLSKSKTEERLFDRNWTLSLKIDCLSLLGVLTGQEFILIHKIRKLRNRLAHGGRDNTFEINHKRVAILIDLCVSLMQRVSAKGNIKNKPKDDVFKRNIENWDSNQ